MGKLEEYRRKRKFDRTPEPAGAPDVDEAQDAEAAAPSPKSGSKSTTGSKLAEASGRAVAGRRTRLPKPMPKLRLEPSRHGEHGNIFVVQKHSATRLHYDFRLAIDGTLKSWAVPKGPSQSQADKRLAVQTEDHPLEYGGFEGKIPEGNYGAGTVMVWDRGTFVVEGDPGKPQGPVPDALQQLERGEIKFSLNGEKLRGGFVLVKIKRSEKGNEWLLIKHKEAAEDPKWNIDEHDGSALTGRSLVEIAEQAPPKRSPCPIEAREVHGALKSAMPSRVEPMLATLVEQPFSDPNWLFEIKWDGVRAMAWISDDGLRMRSRNNIDITARYPELAALPRRFAGREAILDGEIVALDARGRGDFQRLQERMHVRAPGEKQVHETPVVYCAFDLIYCDGYDLRDAPLLERKQLLQRMLHATERFRYADHQPVHGKELYELAKESGLEGIVAKRADSRYVSDRSTNWAKLKVSQTLDAVVGGWTEARTEAIPFGSLLLGLYEGKKLRFIGHVGSGFDAKKHAELSVKFKELRVGSSPFENVPETNEKPFWVKPELVARVKFGGWTQEKYLRHPVFIGLREDMKPEESKWESEVAAATPAVVRATEVVGKVISDKTEIEAELFKGRAETINIELEGKRLRFTNLNKVYFPESGYTKRDLLAYYYRMADYILPFLRGRALVLRRYPDGIQGQAFFQKDLVEGVPEWFKTAPIDSEERGKQIHYATADDRASLLFLTGLGCIDHNPWTSRLDDLEHPDYFFFDLDPSDGTDFSVVVTIARALHEKLEELGIVSFLKTSGATGFHIFIPVEPLYTYEQLRTFGEIIARTVTAQHPSLVTNERSVAKRPAGRVLIDVQQNAMGRPLACAYSVRAFPKAPVSVPVLPRELKSGLNPENLNIKTVFARLKEKGDLWKDFWKGQQRIEGAIERLSEGVSSNARKAH